MILAQSDFSYIATHQSRARVTLLSLSRTDNLKEGGIKYQAQKLFKIGPHKYWFHKTRPYIILESMGILWGRGFERELRCNLEFPSRRKRLGIISLTTSFTLIFSIMRNHLRNEKVWKNKMIEKIRGYQGTLKINKR